MENKSLSYWLKGGIILLIIHTIIFLSYFVFVYSPNINEGENFRGLFFVFLGFPITLIISPIVNLLPYSLANFFDHSKIATIILIFIVSSIQWFFIGSIIGLIYGKVKFKINNQIKNS